MLALEVARRARRAFAARRAARPAIRHAGGGYVVTRSQARLTAEKLAELKDAPGFAPTFLIDGKPPDAGKTLRQPALAATLDHLAHAGLDDFYRGDVGREIAADLARIGSPVTRADLAALPRHARRAAGGPARCRHAFNSPPPTQGLASLMILALFERLRVAQGEGFDHVHGLVEATKRAFRVRDRVITDPDRMAHPAERYLDAKFLAARGGEDRPPQGRALASALWRGRHRLDGRRRRRRSRRLLHPVDLLGIRLRRGAAADRRADAEPRRQLLARSRRAQCAGARAAAVPHAQPGARRARRRPHHGLRHHGRRRPAADAGRAVHAPRALPEAARARDRRAALAAGPHLGLDAHQSAHGSALRRQHSSTA